ncbi:MAG: cytidine deaminase [Bacteroidales bacterium]
MKKNLIIKYKEYSKIKELNIEEINLIASATEAIKSSYAPYSNFNVGAAVLMTGGQIIIGSNQENAAYPSGLCAERTAIFSAHTQFPKENMLAIAIVAGKNGKILLTPAYPCGACRQVMAESQLRSGKPLKIICAGKNKIQVFEGIENILPFIFDGKSLD